MRHFIPKWIGLLSLLAVLPAEANATRPQAAAPPPGINLHATLTASGAEAKPRGKTRGAPKRRPVEQPEEAALAHPATLRAIPARTLSRTRLQPPVHGVIVKGWGEATDAGPATGVSYQVVSGARVVSPCGGRVVFANSFRSYGQLLIVDCGGGYHIVMSGLEKLEVQSGQAIGTGEAVGAMPSEPASATRRQVLYIELRHNGHPVNPALWLRDSS